MKYGWTLLLAFAWIQAQVTGQLTSPTDMHELQRPNAELEQNFIYQVREGSKTLHYRITMSNALYQDNKSFRWPKEIADSLKTKVVFIRTPQKTDRVVELIFNDKIILSPLDSLYYIDASGKSKALERVPPPGICQIVSTGTIRKITAKGLGPIKQSPLFYYTPTNITDMALIQEKGKASQFINPFVAPGQFAIQSIQLRGLPRMPETQALPPIDTTLSLDQQIQQSQVLLAEQKQRDSLWFDSLRVHLILFPERASFETDSVFVARQKALIEESESHIKQIKDRFLPNRYARFDERLQMLQLAQNKSKSSAKSSDIIDNAPPIQTQWNQKTISVGLQSLLGAHLPSRATNPGPSRLTNIQGLFSYSDMIGQKTWSWRLDLSFGYQQWLYNQDVQTNSTRIWGSISANAQIPVLTQQQSKNGKSIFVELGVLGQGGQVQVDLADSTDQWNPMGFGGRSALGFAWGKRGWQTGIQYQYCSDGFGELGLFFRAPVYQLGSKSGVAQ